MNVETLTGQTLSLQGCLCIAIIQSNNFETDNINVSTPKKSRNIFFAYVHSSKKNSKYVYVKYKGVQISFIYCLICIFSGYRNNTQLYIDLIVSKKTENIPIGTTIHLIVSLANSVFMFDFFC